MKFKPGITLILFLFGYIWLVHFLIPSDFVGDEGRHATQSLLFKEQALCCVPSFITNKIRRDKKMDEPDIAKKEKNEGDAWLEFHYLLFPLHVFNNYGTKCFNTTNLWEVWR